MQTADTPKSALEEMQDKIKDEAIGVDSSEPTQTASPGESLVTKGMSDYESGLSNFGSSIFGGDDLSQATAEAGSMAGGSSDAAQGYLSNYSANVGEGLKLSGIKTRGPLSGIRPGEGF